MTDNTAPSENAIDEVARLLAIQIRLQVETQVQAIRAMKDAGLSDARIAELLGTSTATVRNTK
jgi:DNA-binding transcriptional regulator YiaG